MNDSEYDLVFERKGFNAYFIVNRRGQSHLPGIKGIGDSFSWELDTGLPNTSTDTIALIEEEKAMGTIKELPIVRGVAVEYKADYKIYRVIINYNNPKEEMEMLEKLNEIYDELGDDNIVVEYDPVPDKDLERTKRKGLKVITE
jgi:hypothetical protein